MIVARDKTVLKIKGKSAQNNEDSRLARVKEEFAGFENVKIRLGREDGDFWSTIKEESPDQILLGYDQQFDEEACAEKFPAIKVNRHTAYFPEWFKSSKFNTQRP